MGRFGKILIVGASGYNFSNETTHVFSLGWGDLDRVKNLRDYDVLILDLLTPPTPRGSQRLYELLDVQVMLNILHSGEILVLGDPRFDVETLSQAGRKASRPFLEWTGAEFDWHNEQGDTVLITDNYELRDFEGYLRQIHRWEYALDNVRMSRRQLGVALDLDAGEASGVRASLHKTSLARNRYSKDLAFRIELALEKAQSLVSEQEFGRWGPITFLPKTDLSEQETLLLLLADLYDIETGAPEPKWISSYQAPGQDVIDQIIGQMEKEAEELRDRLADAQDARTEARKCLRVLYERGKPLEEAVRQTLQGLEASVETPKEEGKEDGWITVGGSSRTLEGVLEIKGTNSDQFDIAGLRQLFEWVHRGIELRGKKYKAIFVGNSAADRSVDERPPAFSDSWRKTAELASAVAVKTEDLYHAYELKMSGRLDVAKFWENLFTTDGIFNRAKIPLLPETPSRPAKR